MLGRADEAEDCVQDVFLELLSRRETHPVQSWPALLRWITTKRALDQLRSRRARRETGPESLEAIRSPGDEVGEQLNTQEMLEWLRSAVTQLPQKRAQVFALGCFAEMSYDEIASAVGLERGAVGVILHEARQQLWAMLPAQWAECRKARCTRADA